MYTTFTISGTEVYSEADVKAVMKNAYEDIIGFANRGIISYSRAKTMIEDLIFILNRKCLKYFEIRLFNSNNIRIEAFRYEVVVGNFLAGSNSGGINYFKYPEGTKASLYAELDWSHNDASEVDRVLHEERNWGYGAKIG
ncbi:MAG: hypothetical protein ACHQFW_10980 [Chitinophagales bacterium]